MSESSDYARESEINADFPASNLESPLITGVEKITRITNDQRRREEEIQKRAAEAAAAH